MVTEWSTEQVPARARFEQWREACCQHVYALTPERSDPVPFQGSLVHHHAGPLDVAEIRCDGHLVQRREQDIADRPSDTYYVYVQRSQRTWFEQAGRRVEVRAGDIVVADPNVAFSTGTGSESNFDFRLWRIDRARLAPLLARRSAPLPMVRLGSGQGENALIASWLDALMSNHSSLPAASLELAFDTLCALVAGAVGATPELYEAGRAARRQVLLQRVLQHVQVHAPEPDLAPAKVAASFAMSLRGLHQLFKLSGITFQQHLTQARLDKAHAMLRSAAHRGLSTTEIGFACGFGETSTFYRRFKARYGATPGEFRDG